MTTSPLLHPVHRGARAISANEFLDALRTTCVPRFPLARARSHHPIGLAISGGVDSMALAWLCSQIKPTDHLFKVADHPVSKPHALVVNHHLREGSGDEAIKVVEALRALGLTSNVLPVKWGDFLKDDTNPNDLPNVETLARHLRYRLLGHHCRSFRLSTLFTAHHEDDQYETVLMRLLSGHGYRGLRGMRPATDIPECYDMHGVYQSGLVDDQRLKDPLYNMRPTSGQRSKMKREMRHEVDPAVIAKEIEAGLKASTAYLDMDDDSIATGGRRIPPLIPLEVEDGGVMIYRPLLAFSKDRLIATCLENDVPWFEDHTNADQTLTMRNAVRYMHKNHELPAALQKPAVLHLAERCRARVAKEEAEADRLLDRVWIHEFLSNAGTLSVTLPRVSFPTAPRRSSRSPTSRQRRIDHYRHIAALLLRKLLSMVTPERELSQAAQLDHLVSMLFPSLSSTSPPPDPKPYVICCVHFVPVTCPNHPVRWLLSRAPHVSNVPRPSTTFRELPIQWRVNKHPHNWKWPSDTPPTPVAYDGRYWVTVTHRLPCQAIVAPFEAEHHKPFRQGLADDQARKDLSSTLKRYAPAKVRYTLPAIYAPVDVSGLLAGGDWWPSHLSSRTKAEDVVGKGDDSKVGAEIRSQGLSKVFESRKEWERELKERGGMQLIALPTLGIGLPGLDDWMKWEVRYRKVDAQLLRLSKLGGGLFGRREMRARARYLYKYRRPRQRRATSGLWE